MFQKIELYKNSIIKFTKINNIDDIDYLVGIIFLSEMNKYCKNNNLNYHGYYITYPLILLYEEIKNNILYSKIINKNIILDLYEGICKNIEYLNDRITDEKIKLNINKNLYLLILDIKNEFVNLFTEKSTHYINIIDNLLKPYFYILLKISSFIGSGDISIQPNLYKLSEYYANIFYTYIIILKKKNIDDKQQLFENYTNNKTKLYESYLNLNNITNTIDEIINYIDKVILNSF